MKRYIEDSEAPQKWEAFFAMVSGRLVSEDRDLKQDRSRRRSQEIITAAVRVFARDGIARARISDIAAEAGIPVSSIYDYFKTKEDLAYAIPATRMSEFYAEFAAQSARLKTARDLLRLFLRLTTDFARRNPDWARILYLEVWPSVLIKEARIRNVIDDFARVVIKLIQEGGERGEWPPDPNPYQTATILIGAVSQLIITWLLYRRPRDLRRATGPLVDRLMTLLDRTVPHPAIGYRLRSGGAATRKIVRPTKSETHMIRGANSLE